MSLLVVERGPERRPGKLQTYPPRPPEHVCSFPALLSGPLTPAVHYVSLIHTREKDKTTWQSQTLSAVPLILRYRKERKGSVNITLIGKQKKMPLTYKLSAQ